MNDTKFVHHRDELYTYRPFQQEVAILKVIKVILNKNIPYEYAPQLLQVRSCGCDCSQYNEKIRFCTDTDLS
jgi:hypothetical protein